MARHIKKGIAKLLKAVYMVVYSIGVAPGKLNESLDYIFICWENPQSLVSKLHYLFRMEHT